MLFKKKKSGYADKRPISKCKRMRYFRKHNYDLCFKTCNFTTKMKVKDIKKLTRGNETQQEYNIRRKEMRN